MPNPTISSLSTNRSSGCSTPGSIQEALAVARRALAVAQATHGPGHLDLANPLNNLGLLHLALGRPAEAEPHHKRALALRERWLGASHNEVAQSLNNLANAYENQGRYAEAEPLYRRAIAINEKVSGPHHRNVAVTLSNLAGVYEQLGRYAEAERMLLRATQHSRAMRRSMLDLMEKGTPEQAYPTYWAPFVVVGEGAAGR